MRPFIGRARVYVWHTVVCIAVLALILAAVWAVSYALSVHHRHHAERLLQQLAALQPGAASLLAAQQIAKDSSGRKHCTGDLCSYDFENSFAFTNSGPLRVLRRTEWDYLGLRPWQVTARVETRNGELTDIQFMALVGRGRGWLYNEGLFSGNMWAWLMVSIRANSERFEPGVRLDKEYARENAIRTGNQIEAGSNGILVRKPALDTPGSGETLVVNLSRGAPPESRSVAFDLNLRCATAMSPCTELCQLAPSAWKSYSQFQKSNGWWVDEPADCAAATRH